MNALGSCCFLPRPLPASQEDHTEPGVSGSGPQPCSLGSAPGGVMLPTTRDRGVDMRDEPLQALWPTPVVLRPGSLARGRSHSVCSGETRLSEAVRGGAGHSLGGHHGPRCWHPGPPSTASQETGQRGRSPSACSRGGRGPEAMLRFPEGSRNPSFRTTPPSNVHRTQRKPSQPHLHRGLLTPMPANPPGLLSAPFSAPI